MIALNGLQVTQTTHGQALLVMLTLIDHSENMLCENLSCLQDHRGVVRVQLLVDVECAFDSSGGNDQFDWGGRRVSLHDSSSILLCLFKTTDLPESSKTSEQQNATRMAPEMKKSPLTAAALLRSFDGVCVQPLLVSKKATQRSGDLPTFIPLR
jgi:hypothetical protein